MPGEDAGREVQMDTRSLSLPVGVLLAGLVAIVLALAGPAGASGCAAPAAPEGQYVRFTATCFAPATTATGTAKVAVTLEMGEAIFPPDPVAVDIVDQDGRFLGTAIFQGGQKTTTFEINASGVTSVKISKAYIQPRPAETLPIAEPSSATIGNSGYPGPTPGGPPDGCTVKVGGGLDCRTLLPLIER